MSIGSPGLNEHPPSATSFVLRPSARQYRAWLGIGVAPAATLWLVATLGSWRTGDGSGAVGFMLSAPLLGALAGAVWLYLHRVAVTVTPTHVGKVGLIGRPYWRARGDIATVLTATMRKVGDKDTFENLSILDHDGHRIVRMTSVCWSDQDRQRLIQWSGVAPTHLDGVFTGPQLARLYPHAIPAAERHPYLATALMATASAAAAGLVALALLATTS